MSNAHKNKLIYLASPYTHADKAVETQRYEAAAAAVAALMRRQLVVYSPIAYGHPIAIKHKLPTDWQYWRHFLELQLKGHQALWVLTIPGWDISNGVRDEVALAKELGLEIAYVDHDSDSDTVKVSFAPDGERALI